MTDSTAKTVQIIESLNGEPEYVLIPYPVYRALKGKIDDAMKKKGVGMGDYIPFRIEDFVDNPVALARIKAKLSQEDLAERMGVSQAYVSKIENQARVSGKVLAKVKEALKGTK